jgi:hypothetical protein
LRLAVLVAGYDDSRTGNPCHDRGIVHRRCEQPVIAIAPRGHCGYPEFLLQTEDVVTGGGQLAGLGEGPGNVVAGVRGFRGQLVDFGQAA